MESVSFYLLKSVVWILSYAAVYFLFLKNERYFFLNRLFLILGMLCAIGFPFITWHYWIESVPGSVNVATVSNSIETQLAAKVQPSFRLYSIFLIVYVAGILFVVARNVWQVIPIIRSIKQLETVRQGAVKIIQDAKIQSSFSFISYMFVNPSIHQTELCEIMNHEQEHIRQKHWIDLVLFEILRAIQWFNPVVWLYGQQIKQNHEYLADKYALKQSANPGVYHAALLNQLFGGSVISLTNSFNYSFNKKRFNMMNHTIQSPIRKFKLLLILPVVAAVFYAFATPEYKKTPVLEVQEKNTKEEKIRIGNITWEGNSLYTEDELNQALDLKKGNTYSQEQLDRKLYEGFVSDDYLNTGYIFFNLESFQTQNADGTTDFTFRIFEGPQCKIRKVDVVGNSKVSKDEILNLVVIKPGDLFSRHKLMLSYDALAATGKFVKKYIIPNVHPIPDTKQVDIIFEVAEK